MPQQQAKPKEIDFQPIQAGGIDFQPTGLPSPSDTITTGAIDLSQEIPEAEKLRQRRVREGMQDRAKRLRNPQIVGGKFSATRGLVSPETIFSAMTGLTPEQIAYIEEGLHEGRYSPNQAAAARMLVGSMKSVSGVASGATSPAGIAAVATAPLSGPVAGVAKIAAASPFLAEGVMGLIESVPKAIDKPLDPDVQEQLLGSAAATAGGAAGVGAGLKPLGKPLLRTTQRALGVGEDVTIKAAQERAATAEAKQADYEAAVAGRQQLQQTRINLENDMNVGAMALRDNVRAVEQAVRKDLSARYDNVREVVGDRPPQVEGIVNAAEAGQAAMRGSLESKRVFDEITSQLIEENQLAQASVFRGAGFAGRKSGLSPADLDPATMRRMAAQDPALARMGFGGEPSVTATFPELQRLYTSIGRKMFDTELPGGTFRALKMIRDSIGQEMQRMADESGVGNSFRQTQGEWSKYESTFYDTRSLARGGSPVARILLAEDPAYAHAPVTGKASARAVRMLGEYKQQGASPELAIDLISKQRELKALPKVGREPKPPTPEPPIDPAALKGKILEGMTRPLNHWDVAAIIAAMKGVPWGLVYTARLGIKIPAVRKLLSRPTEGEAELARQ